jgi:DNA-binding GntR family transcriptional regulator
MEILSVTRSTLQLLRKKIITGELKPGQRLNECGLSRELGISRPPLRETFRILEKDHLVVKIPRKGTFVTELSLRDFEEICQIREMMECFVVDLLKASGVRDLPKVASAVDRGLSLNLPFGKTNSEELLNGINVLLDFHYVLIESSGNARISRIYHSMSYNLARYQYIYFNVDGAVQHSLEDHEGILELIRDGNYDQAKDKLREHIKYAAKLVKSMIFDQAIFSASKL